MKKRIWSLLCTVCLVVGLMLMPVTTAFAANDAGTGAFTVTGGTYGTDYTYDSETNVLSILTDTPLTVGCTETGYTMSISSNANITLSGYSVATGTTKTNIAIADGKVVNLTLSGENKIYASQDYAIVPMVTMGDTSQLHIKGDGSLEIWGTSNYHGGGECIKGGNLYVESGSLIFGAGNNIINEPGAGFSGDTLYISGGSIAFNGTDKNIHSDIIYSGGKITSETITIENGQITALNMKDGNELTLNTGTELTIKQNGTVADGSKILLGNNTCLSMDTGISLDYNGVPYGSDKKLVACPYSGADPDVEILHDFSILKSDATQHWYECEHCNIANTKADHSYTEEKVADEFLKSTATTTSKAVYYKSCMCGASSKGTEDEATFEYGDLVKMKLTVQLPDNTSTQVQVYSTDAPFYVIYGLINAGKLTYVDCDCAKLYKGDLKLPTEYMGGGVGMDSTLGQLGVVDGDTLTVKMEHTFNSNPSDQEVSPATCMEKKKVYVKCDWCNAYTTEKTVEVGETVPHKWENGVCSYGCGQEHTPHTYKLYTLTNSNFSTDTDGKLKAESSSEAAYNYNMFSNSVDITAMQNTAITIQWECDVKADETDGSGGMGGYGYVELNVNGTYTDLMDSSKEEVVINLTAGQSATMRLFGFGYSGTVTLTLSDDEVPAATCTKGRICTVCGHEGEKLPHTYDQEIATDDYLKTEANCTHATVYYKSCSCGASSEGTANAPTFTSGSANRNRHKYGAWRITKQPTVTSTGTQTRTCQYCRKSEIRSISKLPAAIKVNCTKIPLKVKQSTSAVKVTYKKGDGIQSWRSSNTKVATVTSKGKIKGKKVGTAKITVTLKSGLKKTITVKVQKSAVVTTKIAIPKKTVSIKKGKSYQIASTVTPITSLQKVKYTSSNKKIATVTSKGKVTGKRKGKATITVKSGKKSVKVKVLVK